MTRKSKTPVNLGQHISLAVAAQLVHTKLVQGHRLTAAERLSQILDQVGEALMKVVPVYIREEHTSELRELRLAELEGSAVRDGATTVLLKDGRKLASVTMRRSDLRQAVAILKNTGVADIEAKADVLAERQGISPDRLQRIAASIDELEELLRRPMTLVDLKRVNHLAIAIARGSAHGPISNSAMLLLSAINEASDDGKGGSTVTLAIARLRLTVAEVRARQNLEGGGP